MKLFIGNLAAAATEEDLRQAAAAFGTVSAASVAQDEEGNAKGFGFVEMASKAEGEAALAGLNGQQIQGQAIKVSEARPEKRTGPGYRGGAQGGFGQRQGQTSKGGGIKATGSRGGFQIGKSSGHKV